MASTQLGNEDLAKSVSNGVRIAFGIGALIAVVVGILILVWPGRTALAATAIIAVYAIVAGLVYAGIGIFSRGLGGWARVGHIVLAVVFVVAGIVAFLNLAAAATFLAVFLSVLVGIMWVVEGIVALTTLGSGPSAWTIVFAVLSIVAGVILFFSPLWGAVVLWWLLGISLIVLGVMQAVRAFTFRPARGA